MIRFAIIPAAAIAACAVTVVVMEIATVFNQINAALTTALH